MIKTKQLFTGCLAALACVGVISSASSCGGGGSTTSTTLTRSDIVTDNGVYPIIKPEYAGQVEVEMMSWTINQLVSPWSENKFFQRMEELTGMKIKFGDKIYDRETYGTKFPLCFNSQSTMPDFFYKAMITRENEAKFGKSGDLICLDWYIEEYCPNLKARMAENPMVKKMITCSDGHIYTLPTIHYKGEKSNNADGYYFINKKWCEKVDVDYTTITTIEKLKDVLTLFKNNDMNDNGQTTDEYPMYLAGSAELYYLFGAFGYNALTWNAYVDDNNKIQIAAQETKYKEMLKYLNTFYSNKLLNQDYIDRESSHKWIQLQNNNVGVFCDYSTEVAGNYGNDFVALPVMNSSNLYTGEAFYPGRIGVDAGGFAITKKCKYPEVLMRWIDTLYDVEYSRLDTIGKEGEEWKYDDAAKTSWSFKVPTSTVIYDRTIQYGGGLPGVEMTYDGFMTKSSDELIRHSYQEIAKVQPKIKTGVPSMSLSDASTRALAQTATAISTYLGNLIASTIKGTFDIDNKWDEVQNNLKRMNIEKYKTTLQTEYEAFLAR